MGDVVSGKVSSLVGFGAFVDIGGADGLVHISEISHEMVNDPEGSPENRPGGTGAGHQARSGTRAYRAEHQAIAAIPWDDIYSRLFAGQIVPATIINVAVWRVCPSKRVSWD